MALEIALIRKIHRLPLMDREDVQHQGYRAIKSKGDSFMINDIGFGTRE